MKAIVMSSDKQGIFHLNRLDDLGAVPVEAELDNRVEVDGEKIPVYAMPGTAVIGRTFVLQNWLEDMYGVEVESDDSLNVNDGDEE
jgi:hypothetical protein